MSGSKGSAKPFWRSRFGRVSAGIAIIFAALYLLAALALNDLNAVVAAGPEAVAKADQPLSAPKAWALFLISQLLPLHQPGAAAVTPGRIFKDCPDCPEMVEIPAGFYLMGSTLFERGRYQHFFGRYPVRDQFQFLFREGPRRLVHIAHHFAMSRYELTFAQWEAAQDDPIWDNITGLTPRKPNFGTADYLKRAVTMVDQGDAKAFSAWLSYKTGQRYRIPTEAEWEYAARAGTTTRYPWGNEIGWNNASCVGCGDKWTERRIGPVGLYAPNGFGLYDMIGNGREWVRDCFVPYHAASVVDGSAYLFPNCIFALIKGGSAYMPAWQNRSAMRLGPHNYNKNEASTIRLLREMD